MVWTKKIVIAEAKLSFAPLVIQKWMFAIKITWKIKPKIEIKTIKIDFNRKKPEKSETKLPVPLELSQGAFGMLERIRTFRK